MEFWNSEGHGISRGIAACTWRKQGKEHCGNSPHLGVRILILWRLLRGGEVLRWISRGKVKNLAKNLRGFQKTQSGFFFWNYRAQLNFLQIEFSQQKVEKLFSLEFLKVNKSKNSRVFLPEKYILNPPIPCRDFFGIASHHWSLLCQLSLSFATQYITG